MRALALAVGYFMLVAFAAGFAMFVVNFLACCATKAYCLTMGAHHTKSYARKWSRVRMWCWLFLWHIKELDVDSEEHHTMDGRFVCRWTNWNDWTYAGRT